MGPHRKDGREGSLSPSLFLSTESPRRGRWTERLFSVEGHHTLLVKSRLGLYASYGRTGGKGRGLKSLPLVRIERGESRAKFQPRTGGSKGADLISDNPAHDLRVSRSSGYRDSTSPPLAGRLKSRTTFSPESPPGTPGAPGHPQAPGRIILPQNSVDSRRFGGGATRDFKNDTDISNHHH